MTNKQLELIKLMNDIDDDLGIGLGIQITEKTDVKEYIEMFLKEFTIDNDFTDLLSIPDEFINESNIKCSKSFLEKLNEF